MLLLFVLKLILKLGRMLKMILIWNYVVQRSIQYSTENSELVSTSSFFDLISCRFGCSVFMSHLRRKVSGDFAIIVSHSKHYTASIQYIKVGGPIKFIEIDITKLVQIETLMGYFIFNAILKLYLTEFKRTHACPCVEQVVHMLVKWLSATDRHRI